jgi:hypothetical protein
MMGTTLQPTDYMLRYNVKTSIRYTNCHLGWRLFVRFSWYNLEKEVRWKVEEREIKEDFLGTPDYLV